MNNFCSENVTCSYTSHFQSKTQRADASWYDFPVYLHLYIYIFSYYVLLSSILLKAYLCINALLEKYCLWMN